VDAPLDDVNIQKFKRVLNQFADETQFIVVTHINSPWKQQIIYMVLLWSRRVFQNWYRLNLTDKHKPRLYIIKKVPACWGFFLDSIF